LRESGEERSARDRHLEHYALLAEKTYDERYARRAEAIAELTPDLDNLRAAADWAAETDAELELVGALAWFWFSETTIAETEERLSAALARTHDRSTAWARAEFYAGIAADRRGRPEQAVPLIEQAVAIWRELGDAKNVSLGLEGLGGAHFSNEEDELALRCFEESLELRQALRDPYLVNSSLGWMCQLLVSRGDVDRAEPLAEDLHRRASDVSDSGAEQSALHYLADCPLIRGDYELAEERYARAVAFSWEHGDLRQCANELHGYAMALSGRGSYERALRLAGVASAEKERDRARRGAAQVIPFWTRLLDEHLGRAREALGREAAAAAEAQGRSTPFERAVDEVIGARAVGEA
jgi:tetratricopeptide (TPR) repeat protein